MYTIVNGFVMVWRLRVICQPGIDVLECLFVVLEFISKVFNTSNMLHMKSETFSTIFKETVSKV